MSPTIQILVALLLVIAAVAYLASRLKIPPSILWVLAGVALALLPGLPTSNSNQNLCCSSSCRRSFTPPRWR